MPIPQRHGLTLGALSRYMVDHFGLDVGLEVIEMEGYSPDTGPEFGWPDDLVWINPSEVHTHTMRRRADSCDFPGYDPHAFRPYRLMSALFKARRIVQPDFELWRDFPYEYERRQRNPIDVINGGPSLREWVDDAQASIGDWDRALGIDEDAWREERQPYVIYP